LINAVVHVIRAEQEVEERRAIRAKTALPDPRVIDAAAAAADAERNGG
jgi:hypothetical protein